MMCSNDNCLIESERAIALNKQFNVKMRFFLLRQRPYSTPSNQRITNFVCLNKLYVDDENSTRARCIFNQPASLLIVCCLP